jgi:hypothetical protein
MFRLIKLGIYVAIGYALYEFFQGMNAPGGMMQRSQQRQQGGQRRRMERQAHPQNMTGPGEGRRVQVESDEESGGGHSEVVGRGVVGR